MAYGLD
jgi:hypothetical protein